MAEPKLDDRYDLEKRQILVNGMQAIVRLLLEQHASDTRDGLNTGGFVSGYRGSPLGRLDSELWAAAAHLKPRNILFQPGVNEELAATSIWGAQQVGLLGEAKVDGVFGLWYGKGPGVDRCGDVFKHANMAGAARHGGVLAIAGDDHGAKSSTIAHQSEQALAAAMMPVLAPTDLQDILDLGLFGYALSRHAGCWVGLKVTTSLADSTGTILTRQPRKFVLPPVGEDLTIRWPENKQSMEERLVDRKLDAARAFALANGVDRIVRDDPDARVGILTVGKAHLDVIEALRLAGTAAPPIRILKVAMAWPLEPTKLIEFADGLEIIVVVEEKRAFVESQAKEILYARPNAPAIVGKRDQLGARLIAEHGELDPDKILSALHRVIATPAPLAPNDKPQPLPDALTRKEFFCSGCPHNRSTRVPEGSIALAGIGCHTMASRMPDRNTATVCQMGGEGATWIGQAPFMKRDHVFQNLGDGTYFHSGFLAIRAAIAANINITYKLLFNDAVAMTGGQPIDGSLSVERIARELLAEGVRRVVVVTDDVDRPRDLSEGVAVRSRIEHDAVQKELREIAGVTVLIFEQVCAAEKRRRRKRKLMADPPKRLFINQRVCEGCGDCVKQSSCIAVTPVETPLGRKRAIDQSACNKDFSCLEGFCPSFVELEGATLRKAEPKRTAELLAGLPAPPAHEQRPTETPYSLLITGVGGTGVVTIGAVVAMAAHLDGSTCSVLDMTGLAQKNGAVTSHVVLTAQGAGARPTRIGRGAVDVVIACDAAVAAAPDQLALLDRRRSRIVVNEEVTPTIDLSFNPNTTATTSLLFERLDRAVEDRPARCPAGPLARQMLGDSVYTNMMMLGFTWQRHSLPVSLENLRRAIRLNGASVDSNLLAFELGRSFAHSGTAPLLASGKQDTPTTQPKTLQSRVDGHVAMLTAYHDAAYAQRYRSWIDRFRAIDEQLASVAADTLVRLMAIKDEYEVARLYTDGEFAEALRSQFSETGRMRIWLAPPCIARVDRRTGRARKIAFGPWIMPFLRILAGLRQLRGSAFDPFGWTNERRMERRLLAEFEAQMEIVLEQYTPDRRDLALKLLALPQRIRGFGHVKEAAVEEVAAERQRLESQWSAPPSPARKVAAFV